MIEQPKMIDHKVAVFGEILSELNDIDVHSV